MPIEHRPEPVEGAYPELAAALSRELKRPSARGPKIIEQKVRGLNRVHVTVIWDKWEGIDPADRGSTILDAYERASGAEKMLSISMALGLTKEEAHRLKVA